MPTETCDAIMYTDDDGNIDKCNNPYLTQAGVCAEHDRESWARDHNRELIFVGRCLEKNDDGTTCGEYSVMGEELCSKHLSEAVRRPSMLNAMQR